MRTVKPADERRQEILDCALHLFATKGYDATSVQDIMREVGIAKGTLYYHFKSKEDILDGIVGRIGDALTADVQAVVENEDMDASQKLVAAIGAMSTSSEEERTVLEEVHEGKNNQNALMQQKIMAAIIARISPLLAKVIEQGNAEGIFDTAFPLECAEEAVIYAHVMFDEGTIPLTPEETQRKMMALLQNTERTLGAQPGTFAGIL